MRIKRKSPQHKTSGATFAETKWLNVYLKAIYSKSDFSHLITWLETQDGFLLPLDPISNQMISHLQLRIQMHNILKPHCTKIPGIPLIGLDTEQAFQ